MCPWGIIRIAKLRCPNKESNSRFVMTVEDSKDKSRKLMQLSFSLGSEACIATLSSIIPRNSSDLMEPIVFSSASGTLRFENKSLSLEIPRSEGEFGRSANCRLKVKNKRKLANIKQNPTQRFR